MYTAPLLALLVVSQPALALDPSAPRVGDAIWSRWQVLAGELATLSDSPLGLAAVIELERMLRWVPVVALGPVAESVADDEDADPWVRALAGHDAALALLSGGDVEASESRIAQDGYLAAWSVLGPYPNDAMTGLTTALDPETARDPEGEYEGRAGPIRWRDATGLLRLGYLDFDALAQPSDSAVAYAVTQIDSRRGGRARLWTAALGAYRIWLNGELVGAMDVDLGGGPVREWWDVTLRRGRNELVVKLANEGARLGLYARLTDADGEALNGITASAQVIADQTPLGMPEGDLPTPGGSLSETLSTLLLTEPADLPNERDAALVGAAMVLQTLQANDPSEPWRRYLQDAGGCLSGSPRALANCARVQGQYWEGHRALSRAVAGVTDQNERSWLEYELAALTYRALGEAPIDEARDLAERILARDPQFVPALLLLAQLYDDEGQPWRSAQQTALALEVAPESPEVVYQGQWVERQVGTTPALLDFYRLSHSWSWNDPASALTLVPTLAEVGLHEEARQTLDRAMAIQPLSHGLMSLDARLHLSLGEPGEAEALLLQASELFPGDPMSWEELGRFYVHEGRTDDAAAAFANALAIEPQDELALYRSELLAEEDSFFTEYALSTDQLLELAAGFDAPGRDYYALVQQQLHRIHGNGLGTTFVQEAYVAQTRNGADRLRYYSIQYTPDEQAVELLSARIISPDGTVRESFDRSEESLSQPWYGLYYDYRAIGLAFAEVAPGDILEVSYTRSDLTRDTQFGSYFGEVFFLQDDQPKALVRFGTIHPSGMNLYWREPQLPHEVIARESDGFEHRIYELRDIPRLELEWSMPGISSVSDYVHVSTFATWQQVAGWYWNLIEDQLVSSPEIERTVAELTEGLESTEDKVRAIHEYVVRNTRYVGLEFGIHGFKPYRTTVIYTRRFGDCKDTASLMKVMLEAAGIDSYIVLVRTRDLGNIEELPASLAVFNHAITYVPDLDLYLDGTAGHAGIHELPHPDQGASSLIVMDGPEHRFGTIPVLSAEASVLEYEVAVDLSAAQAPAAATIRASGQFAPSLRVTYEAEDGRNESFARDFAAEYPGASVSDLQFEGLEDIARPVEIGLEFSGVTWLRGEGDRRLLLPLGIQTDLSSRFAPTADRMQPVDLGFPFTTRYRMDYTLPPGLGLMPGSPTEWAEDSPFGRFAMQIREDSGELHVDVELIFSAVMVDPAQYPEFRAFVQRAERAVNQNLTLVGRIDG